MRPLVIDALGSPGARVVVVTAPCGYGKTSHVAAWAACDLRPLAWITVEPLDNDPCVFLTRLAAHLAAVTDVESSRLPHHGGIHHPIRTPSGRCIPPCVQRTMIWCFT